MKQGLIDIGSNSIRLTVYEINGTDFKILFKDKIMAGLAGYVRHGVLSDKGIEKACSSLLNFKSTVEALGIEKVNVFATASLRNIKNTLEAIEAIKEATGFSVDVIDAETEASLGYMGAVHEFNIPSGAFTDIGGSSTEVVSFENSSVLSAVSFEIGSLSLFRKCVKKIMPGEQSFKRIQKEISKATDQKTGLKFDRRSPLICVGGTARAVLKLARTVNALPADCRSVTRMQLDLLCRILYRADSVAIDLILKTEPDRMHTIVPGIMILQHIMKLFDADEILVSNYGVREGYLCQKLMRSDQPNTSTPKTEN